MRHLVAVGLLVALVTIAHAGKYRTPEGTLYFGNNPPQGSTREESALPSFPTSAPRTKDTPAAPARPAGPADASKEVHLISWNCDAIDGNYYETKGEIRNLTSRTLNNVQALVTWQTSSGTFITSDSALIEYRALRPGQRSPFSVLTSGNPQMSNCSVSFKELFGPGLSLTR